MHICASAGCLMAQRLKRLPAIWETRFDPWVGKIPWRRKWQPTPVFLPGESHGGRSLVGYSPRGRKESDTTERLHFTSAIEWYYKSQRVVILECPFSLIFIIIIFTMTVIPLDTNKSHRHRKQMYGYQSGNKEG